MELTEKETRYVRLIIEEFKAMLVKKYGGKKMLRPLHPKMHGCVSAKFIVNNDIDESLRSGIFNTARTFEAVIRFSNSSTSIQSDKKKDVRGMAIKLLDEEHNENFQDFILINHSRFITAELCQYYKIVKAIARGGLYFLLFVLNPFNFRALLRLINSSIKCENVLGIPYFSASPYMLGEEHIAKYAVRPTTVFKNDDNKSLSDSYLKERLAKHLMQYDASYDFLVQVYTNSKLTPVEDVTVEWDAPFVKLATILIPKQDLNIPEESSCEQLYTFAPWHCLPEHQPLGKINFVRKVIYDELAKFRLRS
ncbi:catalase family protein [Flavitalea sp.]|nr:hypothetical protein [Flavitalea sp.]